ncbi:hypothetical protein PHIM7_240 [Sinorhizobium phage phiM7]|uniref:Uncharacterized protein n=2 Tax=Emdodecavirus TaxID=1980937 RepID=S5MVM9_9CAUD|nr:hypothetical protein AB690_gp268 [Sinorhizobium phage phiM12]YP_009601365.1 hypothetical protein FDH46_gp238 [Sinorhizobium phage phiM7]AGR47952.1 hypothetical protein SmphiM12_320 [Sinorhizobium phage phiM12]AKF12785.1 hypothetical protein PHIM7_240 [Sinorhizobium phage phiM7]AKF13146.1 hypothetical protein PHIM19_241 [Sinorhizobium phage phiM19]
MVSAWYHRDVLEETLVEYREALNKLHARRLEEWNSEPRIYWIWERWWKPVRRQLTLDEYLYRVYDPYFEILRKGAIRRELESAQRLIDYSYRSHNNVVLLERWEVNEFGGLLNSKPKAAPPIEE